MEISPVFWDTQGTIKYNVDKDYFKYETSMNINWNNKLARKVLINLIELFHFPKISHLNPDGIAIWTHEELKDMVFYKKPVLFNEISIRDMYVKNDNKEFVSEYPFLTINYKYRLDVNMRKKSKMLDKYIIYDSYGELLNIKSRTVEENLLMLDVFLNESVESEKDFIKKKENKMNKLNKNSMTLKKGIKLIIVNLNNKLKRFVNDTKNETNVVNDNLIDDEYENNMDEIYLE